MKTGKGAIVIERLDERRYAVTVDGIVRYVGTQEEYHQRVAMLVQKEDRADQDKALARFKGGCAKSSVGLLHFPEAARSSRLPSARGAFSLSAGSACGEGLPPARRFVLWMRTELYQTA